MILNIRSACAFCSSRNIYEFMNFGNVALAGAFLSQDQFINEKKYPLRLFFCEECYAVQVVDVVCAETLFKDYFYFSSSIGTLRKHFEEYAYELKNKFLNSKNSTVLEFGCNDGVLLKPLADLGVENLIGVDPAKNVISTINDKRIEIINNYFTGEVSRQVVERFGKIDVICANNVYAHIPDIIGVTKAIFSALSKEGVFIFEVHYLGNVLEKLQYDMVYHEHLYYYSLLSASKHFEKYGMVIFDIKFIETHGGSIRFYVCKNGSNHSKNISSDVQKLRESEIAKGYSSFNCFKSFAIKVDNQKRQLIALLREIRSQGHTIAGYGASGRANTMIQYCDVTHDLMGYIIDDAPAKENFYTPGSHFKIYSSKVLKSKDKPDYLLVFAWSFLDEIVARNQDYLSAGGRLIVPLPDLRVI